MASPQRQVQGALDEMVDSGAEIGLQVAAYLHGELIVDAVAGLADRATGRPVTSDTQFFSFSTGKGITSLLAHLLVKDRVLGYDMPVVELWPEYGVHGKEATTLRHVLTHTAGVPAMPADITPADLADWSRVCAGIATAEPLWQPGTRSGYHSYTYGFLVGELARRATGQPMRRLLHDRIAEPLRIPGELLFGVPPVDVVRLARLEDAEPPPVDSVGSSDNGAVLAPWESRPSAALGNRQDVLRSDIPSVGTVTARGIATMYAATLDGRLLDTDELRELSTVNFEGTDQVFGNPVRMGLGYPLGRIGASPTEAPTAFGWPGGGGSYAYADPTTGIAFALTKNRLTPHFTAALRIADMITARPHRSTGHR